MSSFNPKFTLFFIFVVTLTMLVPCTSMAHWADSTLTEFYNNGYLPNSDLINTPNKFITKGEMIQMINLFYSFEDSLTDLDTSYNIANEKGYIQSTDFDDTISREECSIIVSRLTNSEIVLDKKTNFDDDDDISIWAKPCVVSLVEHGIVKGYPNNKFMPARDIKLCEFVTMLSRIDGVGGGDNIELIDDEDLNYFEVGYIEHSSGNTIINYLKDSFTMNVGDKLTLAFMLPVSNSGDEVFQLDDLDTQISYSISGDSIIRFDKEFNVLEALEEGTTSITFYLSEDSNLSKQFTITVVE